MMPSCRVDELVYPLFMRLRMPNGFELCRLNFGLNLQVVKLRCITQTQLIPPATFGLKAPN